MLKQELAQLRAGSKATAEPAATEEGEEPFSISQRHAHDVYVFMCLARGLATAVQSLNLC